MSDDRQLWDGQEVGIECRCQAPSELSGELRTGTETTPFSGWKNLGDTEDLYRAYGACMGGRGYKVN